MVPSPPNPRRRHYQVGGLTLQVESDLPFAPHTFLPQIEQFHIPSPAPSAELICLRHHFSLPPVDPAALGRLVYHSPPWAIYQAEQGWIYLGILPNPQDTRYHKLARFNQDHTEGDIYSPDSASFLEGGLHSLTTFPTDQILLARLLASRQGCYLHAAGLTLQGAGFAFVGHSEAGKTTLTRQLMPHGEVLCDDRVILRRHAQGFKIYGTWSHGDIPLVSPASAPLRALLLLEQAPTNALLPLTPQEALPLLPQYLVRPLLTRDWWENTLDLLGMLSRQVPVYRLRFDRSGQVIAALRPLLEPS